MANMTERNGLVLVASLHSMHTFSFLFFFFSLCFCFVLFCSVFVSFNFPSWYQFIFVTFNCWKFNFTYFSHNYANYSMFRDVPRCSGMFRNVPCSWFYRRPTLLLFRMVMQSCRFHGAECSSYQVSFPSLEILLRPFSEWILHPFKNL